MSYNKKKNSSTIKGSDGTNKILKGDAQHIVSSKYDKQNNLIEQTKSNWFNKISKTIWKYDEKNHVIFEGTGKYKKWYEYDSHGNRVYLKRISISYLEPDEVPYGKSPTRREVYEEWSEYNSNNILISYKNSNGEFKQYNNDGKLIYFKNIGTDYEFEGWYTYNREGKPLTYKNSQGVEGTYTYENGYEHYKANNGNETWKLRDVNGNTIYSESKNGYTFSEYDAKGNITYSFSKRGRDSTTIWYVNEYWDNGKLKSVKRYHMK